MATKDLTYYFKYTRPSSLPSSVSQATIDSVNRELSEYGVSAKVMALRGKVNISKLVLKKELSLGSMQPRTVLQLPFVISSEIKNFRIWKKLASMARRMLIVRNF